MKVIQLEGDEINSIEDLLEKLGVLEGEPKKTISPERVSRIEEFAKTHSVMKKELGTAIAAGNQDWVFSLSIAMLLKGTSLAGYLDQDAGLMEHFNGFIHTVCPRCVERSSLGAGDSLLEKALTIMQTDRERLSLFMADTAAGEKAQ